MQPEGAKALNITVVDRLAAVIGAERVVKLIVDFGADLPNRLETLERAARSRRFDEVRKVAHDLAGASASLGLTELMERCREIEAACEAEKWDDAQRSAVDTFRLQMRAFEALAEAEAVASAGGGKRRSAGIR